MIFQLFYSNFLDDNLDEDWAASKPYRDGESVRFFIFYCFYLIVLDDNLIS